MQSKKAIVWGTGETAVNFLKRKSLYGDYEIIAFIDNDRNKWGKIFWQDIIIRKSDILLKIEFDIIIICSIYIEEILKQIRDVYGIDSSKIITYKDMEVDFCNKIIKKYENSDDIEIQETLSVFRQGIVNVLGSYYTKEEKRDFSFVLRDEDNYPYIIFEGKRMYYPKNYKFHQKDGKDIVIDILYEQGNESPHLYVKDDSEIPNNAILVDAGVCEGNFALKYVERAKKIYLIEADIRWLEVLHRTFADYKEKVVFCNKYLSMHDNAHEITLDKLISEKIDFLKMDIEGAEVDALLGGRTTLENSFAKCAICSYHRQYDEKYISYILESYGYHVDHSKGYMCFPYDENIKDTLDLRRGVVYGKKMG